MIGSLPIPGLAPLEYRAAHAGSVVPYGDVGALAGALQRALTKDRAASQMVQTVQKFVREPLDCKCHCEKIHSAGLRYSEGKKP